MENGKAKQFRDEGLLGRNEDSGERRVTKAKRHELELPVADVDVKLAEKLDNILKLGDNVGRRFLTNRTRTRDVSDRTKVIDNSIKESDSGSRGLTPRNLTKDELKERLKSKYDTLVPELDSRRQTLKNFKVLSTRESIQLAKVQAKKQLERQLELSSVSGNHLAHKRGLSSFRFNDGYEIPSKSFEVNPHKSAGKGILSFKSRAQHAESGSKTVKFASNSSHYMKDEETSEDDDDLTETDTSDD